MLSVMGLEAGSAGMVSAYCDWMRQAHSKLGPQLLSLCGRGYIILTDTRPAKTGLHGVSIL